MSAALQLRASPGPMNATHIAPLGLGVVGTVFGHALLWQLFFPARGLGGISTGIQYPVWT